jgi:hypothetical protein
MSSTSYSRNKYRCLLRPNHNVIVPNDNINEPKPILNQGPQPRIYPYGYPNYGYPNYGYPGYGYPGYGYPNYGYPGYGYPNYGYGYPDYGYSYPGVYPGTRPYPYVANEKKPRATPMPKNEMSYDYYSSSSSDDECYEYHPDRYYRRHATQSVSPQRVLMNKIKNHSQFQNQPLIRQSTDLDPTTDTMAIIMATMSMNVDQNSTTICIPILMTEVEIAVDLDRVNAAEDQVHFLDQIRVKI